MIGMRLFLALAALLLCVTSSQAAIFGANDLDSLTRASTPNQCYLKSGTASPPAGRIFIASGADRRLVGSAATVIAPEIVVTAGHLFQTDGANLLEPGDQVIFSVWEGSPADCRLVDHAASLVLIGTHLPVREPSRDYAVLKLKEPLTAYRPLAVASFAAVAGARHSARISIAGFAGHASTHLGKDLTVETCRGYPMPVWDPQWLIADSLLVYDCDIASGMSGAPITRGRALIGIATSAMNLSQGGTFNLKDNFNFGYALEPSLLRAIACVRKGTGCKGFDLRTLP